MKNKILSIVFCFAILSSFAQPDSTFRKGYLRVRSQGNAFTRLAADSVMHIPMKTSLSLNDNDLSPQVFVMDSVLYYTVGNTYKVASSGAGSSFDGHYSSLIGTPTLFSGSYTDLINKPAIFSGNYTDLTGKPSIPSAQIASDWNATTGITAIANKPTLFSGSYADLANKPTIPAQVNLLSGTNVTVTGTYPNFTISSTGSGSGGGSTYVPPLTYSFTSTGNTVITLPYAYVSGSVTVSENGTVQANSYTETSSTVITLNYTPFSGTSFVITYTKQ